jgi:SAM-dependent methyltransferase
LSQSETSRNEPLYPYDPAIYRGTAAHYRAGRPPYSDELEATLAEIVGLDGKGRLLDVGCGPGILAMRLATFFEDVVGLEPDLDMLAEASRHAADDGVANVRWVQGVAEDLPDVAPGPYRLVTFGQSFHWTKGEQAAEAVFDLLEPGGAMALIGHAARDRPQPPNPGHPEIPDREMVVLVEKYLGPTPKRALQRFNAGDKHGYGEILAKTRFGYPEVFFASGRADLVVDIDGVLTRYFSTSTGAQHLFGSRLDDFKAEARQLLSERSSTGLFWVWPGDTEIVLARKPDNARDPRPDL